MHRITVTVLLLGSMFFAFTSSAQDIDPKSEDYYGISPYVYCGGNPMGATDVDGKKLKVEGESRDQLIKDLATVFGDKTSLLYFNDDGFLQLRGMDNAFKKGLDKDQVKAFKGLFKAMKDAQITKIEYTDQVQITTNDGGTQNMDLVKSFGGGAYFARESTIYISPKAGDIDISLDNFSSSGSLFQMVKIEQNTTSVLFHEIGERNLGQNNYRGTVIDYENTVRSVIGLSKRPYDIYHSNIIPTHEQDY